jgi:hypothetical protein
MRLPIPALVAILFLAGCGMQPDQRPDPVEIKGTVKLPGGASPKNLTVTFQPQQNTLPGGAKVGADGSFTVKLVPGKYVVYFLDESNASVAAYKTIPAKYRTPSNDNTVSVESGKPIAIEVN